MQEELILPEKELIEDTTLVDLSIKLGFSSRDHLVHPNKGYYYLWMCELQKWLKEKYRIRVESTGNNYNEKYTYKCCFIMGITTKPSKATSPMYDTYEQALEEGLFQALKLIKNDTKTN